MNDEVYDKAYAALAEEGILDELGPILIDFLKGLLSGCNIGMAKLAADLDSEDERVQRRLKARLSPELRVFLLQTYGWGAWREFNGPALVEKLLRSGKKASAAGLTALQG